MTKIIHDISLQGGMNSDDDNTVFPKEDWRHLEDMRAGVSADGQDGVLESFLSDIWLPYPAASPTWPHVDSVYLGHTIDAGNQMVYIFFRYEAGSRDYILEYDAANSLWKLVVSDTSGLFEFDVGFPILNAKVLDGILYWSDFNIPPRRLDILKSKNWTAEAIVGEAVEFWNDGKSYGDGDWVVYLDRMYISLTATNTYVPTNATYWDEKELLTEIYPVLEERELDFDSRPPIVSAEASYATDPTRKSNNVRGSLFQFAYRYIYVDGRRSVYSPASNSPLPQGEEFLDGTYTNDITVNNRIQISVSTGSFQVKRIDLVARSSQDPSTWFDAGSIDTYSSSGERLKGEDSIINFDFYNDIVQAATDTTDLNIPFHWVPRLAKDFEIIKDNRFLFSNIKEGFDPVDLRIENALTKVDLTTDIAQINCVVPHAMYVGTAYPSGDDVWEWAFHFPTGPGITYVGNKFVIRQDDGSGWKEASYIMGGGDAYPADVKSGLQAAMTAQGMDFHVCLASGATGYQICFWDYTGLRYDYESFYEGKQAEGWMELTGELAKVPVLKNGANQLMGFVYYDENRRSGGVNVSPETRIYLPYYNEFGSGDIEMDERYNLRLTIHHVPPVWAKTWQLVHAPFQSMTWHRQFRIDTIDDLDADHVYVKIDTTLTTMRAAFKKTEIPDYIWQKGDRVRFIANMSGGVASYPGAYLDFEISEVDDQDRIIMETFSWSVTYNFGANTIIEIYRPAKDIGDAIYFEIGQEYDVGFTSSGFSYHKGDVDQVVNVVTGAVTTPAEVDVQAYDAYKWKRIDGAEQYWCEDLAYSDFEQNAQFYSHGFAKAVDPQMRERLLPTRFRWGGPYYSETQINDTAVFRFADYEQLPEKYGDIERVVLVGFVLKIIMSHKLISAYIGRTFTLNAEGRDELILSDNLIGDVRPNSEDWGTQNPESVFVYNRDVYFFDRSNAKFCRDSANGTHPISDFKYRNWWQDWTIEYPYSPIKVYGGYNEKHDEIWLTLDNTVDMKTIIFSERRKRWICHVSTEPVGYISMGVNMYKIWDEKIYTMNREIGQGYLTYENNQLGQPKIIIIANQNPWEVKLWQNLMEYSSHEFYNTSSDAIQTLKNINYSSGMRTRLQKNLCEAREGIIYAPIMGDINTPGSDTTEEKVVNGRRIRGEFLIIDLEADTDVQYQTVLSKFLVSSIISEIVKTQI